MARVRGASILGTLDFLRGLHGEAALQRVWDALSPQSREVLGNPEAIKVITTGWYSSVVLTDLTREVDRIFGRGDLALARAAGKHVAFADVNRFFKWMLRVAGPQAAFTRAVSVWNNYHDEGTYVLEAASDRRASIRIDGWNGADPVMCKRVEGWIERALELTLGAAKHPTIREESHLRTDPAVSSLPFCRYVAEWE